jgi:hypothetical protein
VKSARLRALLAPLAALLLASMSLAATATAEESGAEWRLEQPSPPTLPSGQESKVPIGLGKIADIEFWAPNRGLLITAGNPPTIPPGLWAYNGQGWHELATVCGATDGRIAWAGADEFWTISDGRPGQASSETNGAPPLADNTLCRFQKGPSENGEVAASFATLAFRPDSYQAMHAAGCMAATDCWFAGEVLPAGQVGSFHLHWDGSSLTEIPNGQGHSVQAMRLFNEYLYESVRLLPEDAVSEPEPPLAPHLLHLIPPAGTSERPFLPLEIPVPEYAPGEFPTALDSLALSANDQGLWGAANPVERPPAGSAAGEVTIVRDAGGLWSQLFGSPASEPGGENPFTKFVPKGGAPSEEEIEKERHNELINSIAAEPGSESAWLALTSRENRAKGSVAPAMLARVHSDQTVSDRQTLPSAQESAEGVGPKGVADKISCPAPNDCWLATSQGWLFHFADEANRHLPLDADPAFSRLITVRPADASIQAVLPDAPPADDSGLPKELSASAGSLTESAKPESEPLATVALVSRIRTRLIHGNTLEVSFHLATKARVRLLAKRRRVVVARTPMRTFAAGNRKLGLRLNPRRWPTKLDLQTHALDKLPTTTLRGAGNTTVGTAVHVLPHVPAAQGWVSPR